MSSRPEAWTPEPGTAAHDVLSALTSVPGLPKAPSSGSVNGLAVALCRLRRAGYVTRHSDALQPGTVRWARTDAGDHALTRAGTGLLYPQACVLLLLRERQLTTSQAHSAHGALYSPKCRPWIHYVLRQLEGEELASSSGAPAVWALTELGHATLPDARRRLNLPPEAP